MRFSLRDSKQLPGACLARPQNVCTTTACQERDAVAGWTLTGSNQADVG
jgi:hypothetical protein